MIRWKKDQTDSQKQNGLLVSIGILCIAIGILLNRPLLFVVAAFIFAFVVLNMTFAKVAGQKLFLQNKKQTLSMFPGDQVKVQLVIYNHSKIPIQNGKLTFSTTSELEETSFKIESKLGNETRNALPLSIPNTSEVKVNFSFLAKHRGMTKLTKLNYTFPNMFGFDFISLVPSQVYDTELLVFPEAKQVSGVEELISKAFGNNRALVSPFEDVLEAIGTRDYVSSDSLQRVHWKASAKTQKLQTKVFERKWDMSWTVVVNVASYSRLDNAYMSKKLEDYISVATYLCYKATEIGFPIELHINIKSPGSYGYFRTERGEGDNHLKMLLNLLARIKKQEMLFTITHVMYRINQHLADHRNIIFVGDKHDSTITYLNEWKKKGVQVFHIQQEDENYWIEKI
ncbi:DUF58 domain-containing protein [Aquibacillus kalidii]|uniref:DUF58 domain-containing protein n=1 Tax=Aquibacillus kalidii TaxID=2762597 RepID=UPI0016487ACB|nr:DUF58 domain-containing protein [Aquibacillus kalidii]